MGKNNKLYSIQLWRIIATLGVFNGHFLGMQHWSGTGQNVSGEFLTVLRNGLVGNTILSYLFMGDQNVKVFFVLGGVLCLLYMCANRIYNRQISEAIV